jgi:ring-1,2-phenylacetyl-CoA epoxidase subunit PaaA
VLANALHGFKGMSNDEPRQVCMAAVVPFMDEVGLDVPAHHGAEEDRCVIDCLFPAGSTRSPSSGCSTTDRSPGTRSWCAGRRAEPMNQEYVNRLQRGYKSRLAMAA